jgi:Ca-activated chloride channel family protein
MTKTTETVTPAFAASETAAATVDGGLGLLITPLRAAAPAEGGAVDVLVRVQAPEQPASNAGEARPRIPLRLALVVDRSGSMDGAPLAEALRCVQHIGERLQASDELAVVLYDHEVQVPMPLVRSPGAQAVAQALAGVESGGSTDLHAGWEAGAKQLQQGAPGSISRVLLLSDGQANQGDTDRGSIAAQCRQWLERGVSTTTVGLGRGFNEELMLAMAAAGGGQQYYGQRAEDLYDAFDEELALLQAMLLRQLGVKPVPAPGVVVEVLGRSRSAADGWLTLPDLAWGGEAWILLRLHVSAETGKAGERGATSLPAQRTLIALSLQGMDLAGDPVVQHAAALVLPVLPAAAIAALPADETVARRLQEVAFADLNLLVRELQQQGKRAQAQAALARAQSQVVDHPWLAGKLQRLMALMESDSAMAQKEMLYSSGKMRSRLVAKFECSQVADETASFEVPAFLRRKASEGTGRKR